MVDEHASHALLENTRFSESSKHDPAYLPVETRHLRGVSGGELHTGRIDEQMLDACERLFETPCLTWLLHVRCASSPSGGIGPPRTGRSAGQVPSWWYAEIAFAHRPPAWCRGFDEG